MADLRPVDPGVSLYPLAMTAERARHESKRAFRNGNRLPKGHPYRWLPTWIPYDLAKAFSRYL